MTPCLSIKLVDSFTLVNIPKFFSKTFREPYLLCFANGVLTTLAWVALPNGKEPNIVNAETFANANASTTLYCPLSKTNMERKEWAKIYFTKALALYLKKVFLFAHSALFRFFLLF